MRNPLETERRTQRLNREIRLKASVNLLVSLSTCGADRLEAPKLLSNKAKKRFNTYTKINRITNENHIIICLLRGDVMQSKQQTTRLPMTTVARKNGMQVESPTSIQSHMDSTHSPQRTRNTIMNECMKSRKCQRGSSLFWNRSTLSISTQRHD